MEQNFKWVDNILNIDKEKNKLVKLLNKYKNPKDEDINTIENNIKDIEENIRKEYDYCIINYSTDIVYNTIKLFVEWINKPSTTDTTSKDISIITNKFSRTPYDDLEQLKQLFRLIYSEKFKEKKYNKMFTKFKATDKYTNIMFGITHNICILNIDNQIKQ